MGYNKIPLALRYNDTTNNAEGLIEFQLNLSDVGDVCVDDPETGQALVWSDSEWCPSTLPAPGSFNGNLSDVGQVCNATPSAGQALVWSGSEWCPSTILTGGGGDGTVTSINGIPPTTGTGDVPLDLSDPEPVNGTFFEPDPPGGGGTAGTLKIPNGGLGIGMGSNEPAQGGFVLGAAPPATGTFVVGPATGGLTTIAGSNGTITTGPGGITGQTQIDGTNGDLTVGLEDTSKTIIDGENGTITTGDGTPANTTTINGPTGNVTVGAGTNQTTIGVTTGVTVGDSTAQDHVDIQPDGCIFVGSGTGDGSGITLKSTGKIHFSDKTLANDLLTDAGDVCYDTDTESLAIQANANTIIHVGEDQVIRGRNNTGSDQAIGTAVYLDGTVVGSQLNFSLGSSNPIVATQEDQRVLGVLTETIPSTQQGFIQTFGKLTMDTTPSKISGVTGGGDAGRVVYVGLNGGLTITRPSNGDNIIRVGKLEIANATEGIIFIDVQHGFVANDIDDVSVDTNSVVITNDASAVSSLSGVSGELVYFEGSPARPGTQSINQVLTNAGISFVNPSRILAYNTNSVTIASENSSYPRWSVTSTNAVDQANSDITIGTGDNSSGVTFDTAGDYQIDCAVTTSGAGSYTTNCLLAYTSGEGGFTDISESISYSFGSRSESTAHITSIISADAGSKIAVKVTPSSSVNLLTDGTTLRILRLS